ncbi:Cytochrome d ubiquinol oxidase subunit 2 [Desulfurella amilsii]|uniref:Cytochrome d ubiquinol oxidase subunit 2 n=1 Tax=Desulfurella amilsii TaxID=1562698 RepID=A0A1X4XWH7_9BACT|nr:cytochrome d ubiquinol oxidase subunit II [Desulfurella amilsii]OSS41887.1 Cytochrome d ubiquinol oxidase subunit 2 [Desulfurella amilsii]
MDLNIIWFLLVGILIIGYAILDGFDLGVGSVYLFAKFKERDIARNSIAPVWDGNEVWLITGGGALFAAFPMVYATAFSGFYLALILLLFALIFRAISLELRNNFQSESTKTLFDWVFSISSIVAIVLFGVAVGNVLSGLNVDKSGNYVGTFFDLLNPYSILVGVLAFFMLSYQGTVWLFLKTEDEFQQKVKNWAKIYWSGYLILFVICTLLTYVLHKNLFHNYLAHPLMLVVPLLALIFMLASIIRIQKNQALCAIIASSLSIAMVILTAYLSLFPNLIIAKNPAYSLNIYNAASSQLTLETMLIIALIGMPIVLIYTIYSYRVFHGKTKIEEGY